jgi:hypothetical protein
MNAHESGMMAFGMFFFYRKIKIEDKVDAGF